MTSQNQDQKDHLLQEVVTDPTTNTKKIFISISTKDEVVELLSRLCAEDVLEELEERGLGYDVNALADNAGDARQDFFVYTRDELRFLDNSEDLMHVGEMNVDMEVWQTAEDAGWLVDNQAEENDEECDL